MRCASAAAPALTFFHLLANHLVHLGTWRDEVGVGGEGEMRFFSAHFDMNGEADADHRRQIAGRVRRRGSTASATYGENFSLFSRYMRAEKRSPRGGGPR